MAFSSFQAREHFDFEAHRKLYERPSNVFEHIGKAAVLFYERKVHGNKLASVTNDRPMLRRKVGVAITGTALAVTSVIVANHEKINSAVASASDSISSILPNVDDSNAKVDTQIQVFDECIEQADQEGPEYSQRLATCQEEAFGVEGGN